MMKKFTHAIAAFAMIGSVSFATTASAGVFTGTVEVQKGIKLYCDAIVDIYNYAPDVYIDIYPGDPLCAALDITSNLHTKTMVGNDITINGIRVETITLGNCLGSLSGEIVYDYDNMKKYLIVDDTIDPEDPLTAGCKVSGVLEGDIPEVHTHD